MLFRSSDGYALINEAVLDEADYIYTATDWLISLVGMSATVDCSGLTINKITVHAQMKSASGSQKIRLMARAPYATGYSGDNLVTTSTTDFTNEWALNPVDSEAWESADLDNLEIGVQARDVSDTVYIYQMWAVVDYEAAGGRVTKNTRAFPLGEAIGMGFRF